MREYQFVVDAAVFHFFNGRSKGERVALLRAFEDLASNPYQQPDRMQRALPRELSVKLIPGFEIIYWPDHGAKELRIVDVQHL
jgi:hypothetical protein